MDSSVTNDTNKKMNLENMTKEDLIKKCTQLLHLAQKAKQSKSALQEENNQLKEELNNRITNQDPVLQELIENLTQQKLALVNSNQELKTQNEGFVQRIEAFEIELKECEEKLNICDNENTSYKRRNARLTDENEQVIADLDQLEKQLKSLKDIGANQEPKREENATTTELQTMLTVSLEEIKKLKTENNQLKDKVENVKINLVEKDKSILVISEELASTKNKIIVFTDDVKELETLKTIRKNNEQQINNLNDKLTEAENNNQELKDSNVKLKQKIKFYHSKIVKFAGIAKELRQNKTEILGLFKSYIDQVKEWKDQLNSGEKNIVKYLNNIEMENQHLKQKLEQQNHNEHDISLDTNNFENEIKILTDKYDSEKVNLQKELESRFATEKLNFEKELKEANNNIKMLITEIEELNLKNIDTNKLLDEKQKIGDEVEEIRNKYKDEKDILLKKLDEIQSIKDTTENENLNIKYQLAQCNEVIQTLNLEIQKLNQQNLDEKHKLEVEITDIQNKHEEERSYWLKKLDEEQNMKCKFENENLNLETELKQCKDTINKLSVDIEEVREKELNEKQEIENKTKDIKTKYEEEMKILHNKLKQVQSMKNDLLEKLEHYKIESDSLKSEESVKLNLEAKVTETKQILQEQVNEIQLLRKENITISKIRDDLVNELEKLNYERKIFKEKSEDFNSKTQEKIQQYEKTVSELQNQVRSFDELESRSTEEIKSLAEENKQLISQNETLQDKLQNFEYSLMNRTHSFAQTNEVPCNPEEFEEQISNLKRENAELLSEMNEMNQAIKERGENISKLEAHCEEVLKKLQIYETQANRNIDNITEKEKIIENLTNEIQELRNNGNSAANNEINALQGEIESLKEKLNSNMDSSFPDNDTMSTSTISRTEDMNRLKDLEGSWEEKYNKLRNLAIKLKGKVRELTQTVTQQQSENEEAHKKLTSNIKTIQNLQNQCDKLEDELEKCKQECKQLLNQLNGAANDISRDKQSLADKEELLSQLKVELENNKKEKQAMDIWKKQVGAKIQTLRKELDANNVLKKEFEARIVSLNSSLDSKEQALKAEIENHKHTKNLLDQSNNERKKNSVLNLEMEDYERSAKESTKKLEKQQEEIVQLNNQVESQKNTISALREQNKLLEERITSEEQNLNTVTSEMNNYKKQISTLDNEITQKLEKIQSLTHQLETSRSETEELSTELGKVIAEHQKTNSTLKSERDQLASENTRLQQSLREAQDTLRLNKDELKVIQSEYDGYKVRAQSVLRQNQSRDVGVEEKLSEEVAALVAQNLALTCQIDDSKKKIESLENDNNKLSIEIKNYTAKVRELEEDCDEIKIQFADISAKHEKTVSENAETLRNLKVHADTLSQCYRQQLADQESRHNKELTELQNRLEKAPSPTETSPALLTMPRGEGEGSESVESNTSTSVHPIPLERLLGTDSDQEIDRIKKKLQNNESKVTHLTALLSDTEQDLVKHVQMNKLLKEEIRRQQRSEEREKHAENLEYLKNVVFKFVTLNSGDERSRLVPVLNTILKLSPDEAKELNAVAKGELAMKGWSSYLPAWSSPNKPQ